MLTHEEWKEYRRVLKENAAMRGIVEALSRGGIWYDDDGTTQCVFCLDYGSVDHHVTLSHLPDCPVTAARALVRHNGLEDNE